MRYNHISDAVHANISRGIDQYSSVMFMCNTHLLISKNKWKDSGITGVLCLVTCRKLKSNVIRIYEGDSFHLLFEMELYEGFVNRCTFGERYLLVPFINFCFCFLFEDVADSQDCFNAINEMSSYYSDFVPHAEEKSTKKKGLFSVQEFRLINHDHVEMSVGGNQIFELLYKDSINKGAIKKRQKGLNTETPSMDSHESAVPKSSVLLPPHLPPAKLPTRKPSTIVTAPAVPTHTVEVSPKMSNTVSSEERQRLRSELPMHFNFDCVSDESDAPLIPPLPETPSDHLYSPSHVARKVDDSSDYSEPRRLTTLKSHQFDTGEMDIDSVSHQRDVLREYIPQQDLTNLVGDDSVVYDRYDRGVSDISDDATTKNETDFIEMGGRGGFIGTVKDDYPQHVAEIREYQREHSQWGDALDELEQDEDGSVFVIDDANRALQKSSFSPPIRPSSLTIIEENSDSEEEMMGRLSEILPSAKGCKVNRAAYVGRSKESIMIMEDCDACADSGSVSSHQTPHSTLLPSVLAHSSYSITPPPDHISGSRKMLSSSLDSSPSSEDFSLN